MKAGLSRATTVANYDCGPRFMNVNSGLLSAWAGVFRRAFRLVLPGVGLLFFLNCRLAVPGDESVDQSGALVALLSSSVQVLGGDSTLINRATTGLDAWQIGLGTSFRGGARGVSTAFQFSPPNWITSSGDDCVAVGIPDALKGSGCVFAQSSSTIGVCWTRILTSAGQAGRILDTTALMRNSYQSGAASAADKQSVFTHEIGHCLGLQHTTGDGTGTAPDCGASALNCIMFPSTAGADTPHASEISAVQSAYSPTVQSPTVDSSRYFSTSGSVVRHWSFPTFFVSASIGNGFSAVEGTAPQTLPLPAGVITIMHALHEDGSETVQILDRDFRPLLAPANP